MKVNVFDISWIFVVVEKRFWICGEVWLGIGEDKNFRKKVLE